jgi:hypothetical protein
MFLACMPYVFGLRATVVSLATAPRIMRRWLSASPRIGQRPTYVELAIAPRVMRRWLSASVLGLRVCSCSFTLSVFANFAFLYLGFGHDECYGT